MTAVSFPLAGDPVTPVAWVEAVVATGTPPPTVETMISSEMTVVMVEVEIAERVAGRDPLGVL